MRCVYHDGSFHIRVKFCTFTYYWTKKWCWFTPRITEPVRVVEILELSKCRNQGNRFYPQFAFYPRSAVYVLHWPCKLSISSAKYLLYCWVRCLSTLKLWNYPFLVQQCEPAGNYFWPMTNSKEDDMLLAPVPEGKPKTQEFWLREYTKHGNTLNIVTPPNFKKISPAIDWRRV